MSGMLRGPFHRRHRQSASAPSLSLRGRLQRGTFAVLYGPGARIYDLFTDWLFVGEWRHWQDTVLQILPRSGIVLELGSGTGALAARAVSQERRWCCVEPSRAMIDAARRRHRPVTSMLVRGDARHLPFSADLFDGAVATFPSTYILDPATHRELRRVVKPGGILAIVLTGSLESRGARRVWRRRLLEAFYGRGGSQATTSGVGFAIPGFVGDCAEIQTPNGRALVFVGRRPDD